MSRWTREGSRPVLMLFMAGAALFAAVVAVPAVGTEGEADALASHSACVGPAIESAGFDDIDGYPAHVEAAINCLAHYRITRGTSPGTFSPDGQVTRRQMALFLVRAAGPAGIRLPSPYSHGFTDIGHLGRESRDAINQLAVLGITTGTSESTFSPDRLVNRRQMAHFLARFLERAPVGEGGIDITEVESDDQHFRDVGNLSVRSYAAITKLFEMGVTRGVSRDSYAPGAPVTRAQMALFLTRMLAHTNARPAGITMQTGDDAPVTSGNDVRVVISVRDRSHRPIADALIDVFHGPSRRETFDDDGYCTRRAVSDSGGDPCLIDIDDETSDEDGNLIYDLYVDESLVLWAWTGRINEEFDLDTTSLDWLPFSAVTPATDFLLTDDMRSGATKMRYGDSVTFTLQLVDEDEEPVAEEDVEFRVRIHAERDGETVRRRTTTYYTDSSGAAWFHHAVDDPGSRHNDHDTLVTIDIQPLPFGLSPIDESQLDVLGSTQGVRNTIPWSSARTEPSNLLLETSPAYSLATQAGLGGRNRVTATLVDQYGDPVRGERIHFRSDDMDGLYEDPDESSLAKPNFREVTNLRGRATASYYRDSGVSRIETINAFMEDDNIDPLDDIRAEPVEHYWVEEVPNDGVLYTYEVELHDQDRRTMVLELGGSYYVVRYDNNDQFRVDNDPEEFETFARGLNTGHTVDVRVRSYNVDRVNYFNRYSS